MKWLEGGVKSCNKQFGFPNMLRASRSLWAQRHQLGMQLYSPKG